VRIELAATNGMLSGLDRSSQLLDPESYRVIGGRVSHGPDATRADNGTIHPPSATSANGEDKAPVALTVRRIGKGSTVGYLRLETFSRGASADVERELAKLEADGVKGVVLDLRDNTGGLFDEAVKVVDAFVKAGRIASIVSKKERSDRLAHDGGHEPSGPLVVLVNRETASGAELVAAAIKDLGRGIILGETTAGAGSIRVVFDIQNRWTAAATPKVPPRTADEMIDDVVNGTEPRVPPPPPQPTSDDELFGLLLVTGRMLAPTGAEIEQVGVRPDVQPACAAGERPRANEDCPLQLAQDVVVHARDPQRATLLSTARALANPVAHRPTAPARP
jgi:C-terminal processing protease CtpA/Prc